MSIDHDAESARMRAAIQRRRSERRVVSLTAADVVTGFRIGYGGIFKMENCHVSNVVMPGFPVHIAGE